MQNDARAEGLQKRLFTFIRRFSSDTGADKLLQLILILACPVVCPT